MIRIQAEISTHSGRKKWVWVLLVKKLLISSKARQKHSPQATLNSALANLSNKKTGATLLPPFLTLSSFALRNVFKLVAQQNATIRFFNQALQGQVLHYARHHFARCANHLGNVLL